MRREGSEKVQSLEAALQEAHDELKAEKLLLQEVAVCCPVSPACAGPGNPLLD